MNAAVSALAVFSACLMLLGWSGESLAASILFGVATWSALDLLEATGRQRR